MRRRAFIAALGGAVAWPLVARAQQPSRPTIGLLGGASPEDKVSNLSAFARGLTEAGYVEGKNLAIEYRWARGEYNVLSPMAADLVGHQVSVIATFGTNAALAAKAATTTIPIVFVNGGDPIASGLVESLSRPGGNITGVNLLAPALNAKRLELLNETVPQARVVAMLVNPRARNADPNVDATKTAAGSLGKQLVVLNASTDDEIAADADAAHLAGLYTGRILKGEKPSDLPVQRSTKIELVLNLKTAKALGLTIPSSLLARADEVIERNGASSSGGSAVQWHGRLDLWQTQPSEQQMYRGWRS